MTHEPHNKQAKHSFISRARRIGDKEWEAFRPQIEELYQEQGYSRKALIEKLSQDGFPVTEKQLKHILQKWGTKKKVSSTDMQSMLAVKRTREEDGKSTEFMYHGHVVGEAKLQRAGKRYKIPNSADATLPSYIEVFSPKISDRSPPPSQPIAQNSETNNLLSSLTHPNSSWSRLFEESSSFTASQQRITISPYETDLGTLPPQTGENQPSWVADVVQTNHTEEALPPQSPGSFTSMAEHDFDLFFFMEPLEENNMNTQIDVSPAFALPLSANTPSRPAFCSRLPTPVPNSSIVSPIATPIHLEPAALFEGYPTPLRHNLEPVCPSNEIIFYDMDPQSIITSMQMMRKLFHCLQDDTFRKQHITSRGTHKRELYEKISSQALLSEIDEIAIWAYQASGKMIQQQRAARQFSCVDTGSFSQSCNNRNGQISQDQALSGSKESNSASPNGTLISYCDVRTECTTGGRLQIQLRRTPKRVSDGDEDDALNIVAISVIPQVGNRAATGIYVTMTATPRSSQSFPIYTSIRTFNVVPENSEIIIFVKMNHLEGVRRLMEEKKASPRDVDPRGFSLLSYAMYSGCSETFQLLLEGGASTDQCEMFSHTCNLIDAIWTQYVDTAITLGGSTSGFTMKYITDLGQCRSMTERALASGCFPGETLPWNPEIQTPLFRLSKVTMAKTKRSQVADTLKELLRAGYDKEVQNGSGKTALLYTAFSSRKLSLTLLELLLAEDVNIHAVDNHGRGALHLCLNFSAGLQESFLNVCRGSIPVHKDQFATEYFSTTEASGDITFDSNNEAPLQEILSPDGEDEDENEDDVHIVEDSDVESVDYDSKSFSDDTDYSPGPQGCYWCGEGKGSQEECLGDDDPARFEYCEDRDVDDFNMPEASDPDSVPWMCKARLRLKLVTLLRSGCCPNILDSEGLSPSDYATAEGLWPQWEWALSKIGFVYDEFTNLWVQEC